MPLRDAVERLVVLLVVVDRDCHPVDFEAPLSLRLVMNVRAEIGGLTEHRYQLGVRRSNISLKPTTRDVRVTSHFEDGSIGWVSVCDLHGLTLSLWRQTLHCFFVFLLLLLLLEVPVLLGHLTDVVLAHPVEAGADEVEGIDEAVVEVGPELVGDLAGDSVVGHGLTLSFRGRTLHSCGTIFGGVGPEGDTVAEAIRLDGPPQ